MYKSIKFKHKIITRTKCCNNIERFYYLATPEEKLKEWYAVERAFCDGLAVKYEIPLPVSTGIVSSISPQKGWEENKNRRIFSVLRVIVAQQVIMSKRLV
jgi:hypothetical protein